MKLYPLQHYQLHFLLSLSSFQKSNVCSETPRAIRSASKKVKYGSFKTLHLICLFKLAPLITINLPHYISPPNYMCYKGIIALKDAYRDPSSSKSDAEFSLVINRGVHSQEVLTSRNVMMKFREGSFRCLSEWLEVRHLLKQFFIGWLMNYLQELWVRLHLCHIDTHSTLLYWLEKVNISMCYLEMKV